MIDLPDKVEDYLHKASRLIVDYNEFVEDFITGFPNYRRYHKTNEDGGDWFGLVIYLSAMSTGNGWDR